MLHRSPVGSKNCRVLHQTIAMWLLQAGQPAFFVAQYLQNAGVEVVPVPVYYPEVTEILGKQVYRKVADVPGENKRQALASA